MQAWVCASWATPAAGSPYSARQCCLCRGWYVVLPELMALVFSGINTVVMNTRLRTEENVFFPWTMRRFNSSKLALLGRH